MIPLRDVIPSRTTPYITLTIIALNAAAWIFEVALRPDVLPAFLQVYGVVPANFHAPTLVTSMFLHGSWSHVIGNMWYLWIFGDNVEDRFGHFRYLVFYLFSGAVAALGQVMIDPFSTAPMIGASGAIAGVMGAYFVLYPRSRILTAIFVVIFMDLVEVPAIFFLGIWFVMQLLSGVGSIGAQAMNGGVAFWAHIGGFAIGALAGAYWRLHESRRYWAP